MRDKTLVENVAKKQRTLVIGVIVFAVGIAMYFVPGIFVDTMSLCKYPNFAGFPPGKTITTTCSVVQDVGQDLVFRAVIYHQGGPTVIGVPAHAEIRDPDGRVIQDVNFEGKLVLYIKPELRGNYTATITSLEDKDNRVAEGTPNLDYVLGYPSSLTYGDVYSPVATARAVTLVFGNMIFLAGIGIIIYGVIKAARKK